MFRYLIIVFVMPILMAASCNTGTTTNNGNNGNNGNGEEPPVNTLKCDSADPVADVDWLKKMTENAPASAKVEITRYELDGEYFFLYNNCVGCADGMVTLYTCDQGKKCTMGGIAGVNTCGDFFDRAGKPTFTWRNYEPEPGR